MTALPDDILDLLAAYALGALEPDEIAQVSALLTEHPELRATLAELRATADRLPYGLPEAVPAPELRQRVLDHATGRASTAQPIAAQAIGRTRAWIWSFTGVAMAALLFAAIGWAQLLGARNELAQSVQTRTGGTLLVAQLPPLSPGRVYQLWRIPGGGNPLSTGLFKVDQQGYGQIILPPDQQPQAGETVAVTDEPDGGSPGPTTQILIVGTTG